MDHQYTIKDLPNSRQQLTVTKIDQEILDKAEKKVLVELSKNLKLKGFRPGKIPEHVVRENIQASYVRLESIQKAIPDVANAILVENKTRVIGEPHISLESEEPLKVVLEYDIFPSVTVGDYKSISVKSEKKTATDKEIKEALEHVTQRMTEYKKVERGAKKDDRIEVDFSGKTPDGVALDNTASKNHPVVIGSNMLTPGFEDELIGLKAGDEKSFEITFPKDYHSKQMAEKKVIFDVKVHHVEESFLPEMNEEFIEKMTGKKQSLEDWKKEIKDQIQQEHDREMKRQYDEKYYDKLIALTKIEFPQTLIDQEKQDVLHELKQQILNKGLSYEHYLQANGKTEEQLLESFDKQAKDRLALRMALQDISEKEKIEVSDVDIEERLNELLKSYPEDKRAPIKQQYAPESAAYAALEFQVRMQKTLEKIRPKE